MVSMHSLAVESVLYIVTYLTFDRECLLCSADHGDALQRLEDMAATKLEGWERDCRRDDRDRDREDPTAEG